MYSRALHALPPLHHDRRPALADAVSSRDDIIGIEAGEQRLVRRSLPHAPEEATLGIRRVRPDVEGPLLGRQAADDVEARLVDGALGLLRVLERHATW